MRSNAILLIVALGLFAGCSAPRLLTGTAADARPHDEFSPDADDGDLAPILPEKWYGGSFEDAVRSVLLDNADSVIWMICIPSRGPEYAVALVAEGPDGRSPASGFSSSEYSWSLVVAEASEQLWGLMPQNGEPAPSVGEMKQRVPVHRTLLQLDPETASIVLDAWEQVVSRTRYALPAVETTPEGEHLHTCPGYGSDGVTYSFRARGFCGETWSPRRGLAGDLVRLTDRLRELASADEEKRPEIMRSSRDMAARLFEAAQRKPW